MKALDLLAFQCMDRSGRPEKSICTQSQRVRKDFRFLIEVVINALHVKLLQVSSSWTLPMAKAFPDKEGLQIQPKYLKSMIVKIASVHTNNTIEGELLLDKCKQAFVNHFAMYESWKMKQFVKDVLNPLIIDASKEIDENILKSCEKETELCTPSLLKAYANLYLPFFVVKIPIMKLGFGQFLSYFSRLVTKNDDGDFLISSKASKNEKYIEQYQFEVD